MDSIEASEVYNWKPLQNIDERTHSLILGIQGHLWSETITKKDYIDIMINPRLATLSQVAWSKKSRLNWQEFRSVLMQSMKFMSKLGWEFHDF